MNTGEKSAICVRVDVVKKRKFLPHLLLFRTAVRNLETAKKREGEFFYDRFSAILFSALCLEAIGNTYGKFLIPNWKELLAEIRERKGGASPIDKLRLVAERCGVTPDFECHPWLTAQRLGRFRNLVAHPTREDLEQFIECNIHNYVEAFIERPESELEMMITEEFATQSCDAIDQILQLFKQNRTAEEMYHLELDGTEVSAKAINESSSVVN